MPCAVSQYSRGEFFASVDRITPGKGQTPVFYIFLHIICGIYKNKSGKIPPQPPQHRDIPVGKEPGLSPLFIFFGAALFICV